MRTRGQVRREAATSATSVASASCSLEVQAVIFDRDLFPLVFGLLDRDAKKACRQVCHALKSQSDAAIVRLEYEEDTVVTLKKALKQLGPGLKELKVSLKSARHVKTITSCRTLGQLERLELTQVVGGVPCMVHGPRMWHAPRSCRCCQDGHGTRTGHALGVHPLVPAHAHP
jgi:hypothetical protein